MLSVSYTRRKGQDFFMSIFENTVMIKKRPSYGQLFAQYLLIALTILSALGTILFSPLGLFVPTVLFAVFAYFMHGSCDMEYEYTYIEGELDIDKIKAKRKRKKVAKIDRGTGHLIWNIFELGAWIYLLDLKNMWGDVMLDNKNELPMGLGFGLAMNEKAMNNFSAMGEEEKHQVIEAARNVRSKREMQNLVNDIANLDAMV